MMADHQDSIAVGRLDPAVHFVDGNLIGWTIYRQSTTDLPGAFITRAWLVRRDRVAVWPFIVESYEPSTWHAFVGCCYRTLDEARADIGPQFVCLPREPGDALVIVESWV